MLIEPGINIVTYYAPTLFQTSLGMSQHMALLLGALLQVWYLGASFVTVSAFDGYSCGKSNGSKWYTIDSIGRRKLFIANALGMCFVLVAEAICVGIKNTKSAIAAVVFVFAFEACFTWGKPEVRRLPCFCVNKCRLDGNGLVLSTGNTSSQDTSKRRGLGSCSRFLGQFYCG